MPHAKDFPPGFRAPGSDLVVRRTVGLRTFGKHDRGQAVECVCMRARPDKGGEPCGNIRTVAAKRLKGRRGVRACEECARIAKRKGRTPNGDYETANGNLRATILTITKRNYREYRDELEREGGPRWAEFLSYRARRLKLKNSTADADLPFKRAAWTIQMEIEAIQVVLCSPSSGRCCARHESGDADAPDDETDNESPSFWRALLEDETERND